MSRRHYDVIVIGAGAAGLVTAVGAAHLGTRVALVEKHRFGGECLWTGCVPSKALIRTARSVQDLREAELLGLPARESDFEFASIMQSMREVIARIQPHDDPETLRSKGVTPLLGKAELVAPGRVAVDGVELVTKRIVIATGSRPIVPALDGLERVGYVTHEGAFELERLPGRLLVLGGGPIGLELAQVFQRLGSEVTVVERADRILPREDHEVSDRVRELMEAAGVRFLVGQRAVSADADVTGKKLMLEGRSGERLTLEGDEILVATGMRPFTESLGLDRLGVELEPDGAVRVDDKLRTTASGVWAAGDVTGKLFFTHVADYQARLLVRNMFFPFRAAADYSRVPWAVFTDPPLAHVGLTEREARQRFGDRIGIYRYELSDLDRALTDRAARGLVKLITDRRGRIIGGHVVGGNADSVIHEIALAMRAKVKIGGLSQMVHVYPTWPEGVRRAADRYYAERFARSKLARLLRWWAQR